MAALGCLTATTQLQIGQPCATTRYDDIRVARFQGAITRAQAVNGRSQYSCSVAEMRSGAVMTGDGRHRAYQSNNSAWGRGNNTIISGRMPPSLGSQSGGWWGNILQIFRPSNSAQAFNNSGNDVGEDVRVPSRAREPAQWLQQQEPEAAADSKAVDVDVVEVKKAVQNANVAEKALDKGSNVATSALDKVGDVLRTTGLEIDLDLGLEELTVKELVLKDLKLVLNVKTKPRPPQAQAEKGGGNNTA